MSGEKKLSCQKKLFPEKKLSPEKKFSREKSEKRVMACDVASVAIFLDAEITQVIDSIPWVRCASGNVYIEESGICAVSSYCLET